MKSKPHSTASSTPSGAPAASVRGGSDRDLIDGTLQKWSDGDFHGCLADLDDVGIGRHTSESILLRARALLRLQRAEEAKQWLEMMEARHVDNDALATHAMLLGSAYSQLRRFDDASTLFGAIGDAAHPTIVTETAYYHALSLWQARDFTAARAVLQPAIRSDQDIVTARSLQLLGFIEIAEQNFSTAHRHFEAALESLVVCRARDKHLEATLLHVLSIGAAEVDVRDPVRLDRRVRDFEWTDALVTEHVQAVRHVGLAYARTDQPAAALDRFIEAAAIQRDSPWAIVALCEAANLCLRLDERVSAGCYVRTCSRIAEHLCWDDVAGEARLALLNLAACMARNGDGVKARRYLDLYFGPDRRGARLPALSALNFDSRLQSFERHAEALVAGALDHPEAPAMLADVANEWARLKYRSRAAEARIDIRKLTKRSYPAADGQRAEAGRSADWPAVNNATHSEKPTVTITSQQDRIVRLLVQGRTIADIAEHLALQQKTVRNHLVRVYEAFDVVGQSQLIVTILRDSRLRAMFLG